MNYKTLLISSRKLMANDSAQADIHLALSVFTEGGEWMYHKLHQLDSSREMVTTKINYNFYGFLKYSTCVIAFLISFFLLFSLNIFLTPFSILVFYFFEVQFLFLFPLLIDGVKNPLSVSMRQTFRIGIIRSMMTVMPIGLYMISGLFNYRHPFRRWYTGCLAILIWYQYEVRDRV